MGNLRGGESHNAGAQCSGFGWLGGAEQDGKSCGACRQDWKGLKSLWALCRSINHGGLGCSFGAFLSFPIWSPVDQRGGGSRAEDKQQEPSVRDVPAEPCSSVPQGGWCGCWGAPLCVGVAQLPSSPPRDDPVCSFSSTHMQLRLSSLICRIIVLQKYTVCFREEARLVRALMSGSSWFLDLTMLPVCCCRRVQTPCQRGLSLVRGSSLWLRVGGRAGASVCWPKAGWEQRWVCRGALQAPLSPQEDCEFYLVAHQFIVLPMERQRVESSDGYGPQDGWGALPWGGFLIVPERVLTLGVLM